MKKTDIQQMTKAERDELKIKIAIDAMQATGWKPDWGYLGIAKELLPSLYDGLLARLALNVLERGDITRETIQAAEDDETEWLVAICQRVQQEQREAAS